MPVHEAHEHQRRGTDDKCIYQDDGRYELSQRRRLSVKPGLTCLWQIQGRSLIPFDEWVRLDLEYIDQWSLLLDLRILALTVPAVVRTEGAS